MSFKIENNRKYVEYGKNNDDKLKICHRVRKKIDNTKISVFYKTSNSFSGHSLNLYTLFVTLLP